MSKKETAISLCEVSYSTRVKAAFFTESPLFQGILLLLIILNAAGLVYLVSAFSNEEVVSHPWFFVSQCVLHVFLWELVLRIYSSGLRFFRNVWNVVDAIVILISLYPPFAIVSILRVLRLMRATGVLARAPGTPLLNHIVRVNVGTAFSFILMFFVLAFTQATLCTHLLAQYEPAYFNSFGDSLIFSFQFMFLERPDAVVDRITFYYEYLSLLFLGIWLVTKLLIGLFFALVVTNSIDVIRKHYR